MPVVIGNSLQVRLAAEVEITIGVHTASFVFRPFPKAFVRIGGRVARSGLGGIKGLALLKMLSRVAHHDIHIVVGRPSANDVAR